MKIGLKLVGFKRQRIRRARTKTNVERFKGFFGASPAVYAEVWEDLQKTDVVEARVPPQDRNVKHFLMAMHHLKRYPTELEREAMLDISRMWGRDWCWYFIEKVQALKARKIVWPDQWDDVWAMTVDGQHCWVHEQLHPIWSQDQATKCRNRQQSATTHQTKQRRTKATRKHGTSQRSSGKKAKPNSCFMRTSWPFEYHWKQQMRTEKAQCS